MTEAEREILESHLTCDGCGAIATRDEHRSLMCAMKAYDQQPVFRIWMGWEVDTRAGRAHLLCPACTAASG